MISACAFSSLALFALSAAPLSPEPSAAPAELGTAARAPAEETAEQALPNSAWAVLTGTHVELTLKGGSVVTGQLLSAEGESITLSAEDGRISARAKTDVVAVRALAPSGPAPTVAPSGGSASPIPPSPGPAPTSVEQPTQNPGGWAVAGGVVGIVLGSMTLGLAAASDATLDSGYVPSMPLGGVALLTMATATPVAIAGGGSARRNGSVRGSVGLRATSWVTYGVGLTQGFVLLGMGAAQIEPPHGVVGGMGAVGFVSAVLGSVDAFVSYKQATKTTETAKHPPKARTTLRPGIAPTHGFRGVTAGLSGAF